MPWPMPPPIFLALPPNAFMPNRLWLSVALDGRPCPIPDRDVMALGYSIELLGLHVSEAPPMPEVSCT